jgi:hypothetical protein
MGQAVAGEHGAQALAPLENVPIGQVEGVKAQAVAPCVLKAPVPHGWQKEDEVAPIIVENVPAAHGTHVELIAAPTKEL